MSSLYVGWERQALNEVEFKKVKRNILHESQMELRKQNAVCSCCGLAGRLTKDHIVPKSRGGKSDKGNIQLLCAHCNRVKADRVMTLEDLRTEIYQALNYRLMKIEELMK